MLSTQPLAPIARFRLKLEELGYTEGRNLSTEARFSIGRDELYPSLALELIPPRRSHPPGEPAALAAKHATSTVPIVIVAGLCDTGIVSNLANPGGNVTGFSAVNVELEGKRLELLRELVPGLARVGVLANAGNRLNQLNLDTVRRAASAWGLSVEIAEVLVTWRRLPAVYGFRYYVTAGGLISYGPSTIDSYRRAAGYVDRILRGEKPADLPVQAPTKYVLVINLKTAKALGLDLRLGARPRRRGDRMSADE